MTHFFIIPVYVSFKNVPTLCPFDIVSFTISFDFVLGMLSMIL